LNDPEERCQNAESASVLDLNGITTCESNAVNYCISFTTDKPGNVLLLLDFDGRDGVYTAGTADKLIPFTVNTSNLGSDICINWDGTDGLGNQITGEVPLVLEFIQGRYNLPIFDAEFMVNGFMIEAVRPAGPAPQIFYNDTDIPQNPGNGSDKDGTAGCTAPCHNWNNYVDDNTPGYGNLHTINTWWFSNRLVDELIAEFPVVLSCEIDGPAGICPDAEDVLTLTVSESPDNGNTPDYDVVWDGPNVVSSDDVSATINAPGTYSATVSWTTSTGEMCSSSCEFNVDALEEAFSKDSILVAGQDFTYEGQTFTSDTIARFIYAGMASNGCDSIFDYCIAFRPDVELFCSISGPEGICEGGFETLTLSTSHEPSTEPFPTINSISWDGQGIINSTDSTAVVAGGATYTVTIEYTDQNDNDKVATCEITVDQYPNVETKVDEVIPFGGEIEINGVIYDSTTVDTFLLSTVNGCDSTVVVCVTEEDPDIVLTCELSGPEGICMDETGLVVLTYDYTPVTAPDPIINFIEWTGNGIVSTNADLTEATVTGGDTYAVQINYTNPVNGETKDAFCEISVDQYPTFEIEIDTIKESGQTITINGVDYDSEGEFLQQGSTSNGCDSLVIIRIVEESALLCYDLDDCKSIDYTRFTPKVAAGFDCGEVSGSYLYRENPLVNGHSCTEGVNGGNAICISSIEDCEYVPGDEKSAIIDVVIVPAEGKSVRITGLDFYERAPEEYQWNVGTEGLNNYPTLYGVRVVKNGTEIFSTEGEATTTDWTLEQFSFISNSEFVIDQPALVRFELLAYCTVGNDSHVTAWDLDEIKIKANCVNSQTGNISLAGNISDTYGSPLKHVELELTSDNPDAPSAFSLTDESGKYAFNNFAAGYDYRIVPELDRDHLKGVTTADLIHIQRHILGLKSFDSAYQYIAADADNSGRITAIDLLELRKLILGVYEKLPSNTSYRFGIADQDLSIENAFAMRESIDLENADYSFVSLNFNGIKIGDVSSLIAGAKDGSVSSRSLEAPVKLTAEDIYLEAGINQTIELAVDHTAQLNGLQLAFNVQAFEYFNTNGETSDLYGFTDKDNHIHKVIWTPGSEEVDGSIVFNIVPGQSGYLSELLTLDNSTLENLAFAGDNLDEKSVELTFESSDRLPADVMVSPNPFAESFTIAVTHPEASDVNMKIFTLEGRLLYSKSIPSFSGNYSETLNQSDINNYKGVMILSIHAGERIITKRIVRM